MGIFDKNKFDSVKQDWATPIELFQPLMNKFKFTLDAAADNENKKVNRFYSKEDNGLLKDWANEIVWCNPPYGREVPLWLKKGMKESGNNCMSCFLVPARTNTGWFHDICLKADEILFIKGRPKFYNYASEDKEAKHGLPVPLMLVIFRPESSGLKVGTYDFKKTEWKNQ